jgi:hypothetical protein
MLFSDTVVRELAKVWTRLHGAAAQAHIEYLIGQAESASDVDGAANYRRVLALVTAYEQRRRDARARNGASHPIGTSATDRTDAREG